MLSSCCSHRFYFMIQTYDNNHKPVWRARCPCCRRRTRVFSTRTGSRRSCARAWTSTSRRRSSRRRWRSWRRGRHRLRDDKSQHSKKRRVQTPFPLSRRGPLNVYLWGLANWRSPDGPHRNGDRAHKQAIAHRSREAQRLWGSIVLGVVRKSSEVNSLYQRWSWVSLRCVSSHLRWDGVQGDGVDSVSDWPTRGLTS